MNAKADNRAQELKAIFLESLDRTAGTERRSYLEAACGSDAALRCEVESLLLAHQKAGEFLDPAAFGAGAGPDHSPLTEAPGTVIGRYKLLEKIGEGGMAVVYMAEQTEPIRRKVAFKIIKLGMDTRQVIARFEAERQALALMDHPNIAKVLDAGATETGRPYFVMELVQGVSITDYCDQNKLNTKDRLSLFIQVCHAVQHAHQKGVIHRDIKPSNVMVTHRDGTPVPKVIDFGIAKATNQRLTEKTLFTRYAHLIGTPAYMSPEQAELSDLDVDTRSDIYSLGVLLYELLTGTTPFSEEELRKAGYIEMQRVIREQEPAKPSTKLSTLGKTLTDIAKHRGCTPDLLRKAVRGDLDWIVMKSLEKDRARRYETPNSLASDILRHLKHEPVTAGSPGVTYRLQKFCRRHRSDLAAAAVVLVLLIGSVGGVFAYLHSLKVKWARQEALPMITRLANQNDYLAAFFLAEQVGRYIPDDPILLKLWPEISRSYTVRTDPDGADVYYKEYSDVEGEWLYLGRSPLESIRFPWGVYRWRIAKDGFEQRECVAGSYQSSPGNLMTTLKEESSPSNMVPIDSQNCGTYLIDKYEVTNEQYKKFIDGGGYQKRDYWRLGFTKDGEELPWEQAMLEFRDKTEQPGPSTWEGGTYATGQGQYPVSGISWYEAAAYAECVGKKLPTVAHWEEAARYWDAGVIIPASNFGGSLAPVGSHPGIGRNGVYDMAGNVREWCFNAADDSGDQHYILGGAWTDPEYMFGIRDIAPAWDRSARNGFRCVSYLRKESSLAGNLFDPIERNPARDRSTFVPFTEEEFRSCKAFYAYDRADLEATIEQVDDSPVHWREEKITFNVAYGNERMTAYLLLPKNGVAPFQTVVFFPSNNARRSSLSSDLTDLYAVDFVIRSGRALLYPIYMSTYERRNEGGWPSIAGKPVAHRYLHVQMYQDMARSIDYLESREDIDLSKLAYWGQSWGAGNGPLWIALESRIKVAVLVGGGVWIWEKAPLPEADPVKLAAHVKVPTIMFNGIYDVIFPYETAQRPMFELLGTPAEHKVHRTYPTGHGIGLFRKEFQREVLDWLDKYVGPPNKLDGNARNGEWRK